MPPDPKPPTVEELHLEALTLARNMAAYAQIPGYPWQLLIRSIDALVARVRELERELELRGGVTQVHYQCAKHGDEPPFVFHLDRRGFIGCPKCERDEARGERDDFKTTMLAIRKQRDDYAAKVLAFDAGAENLVAENARLLDRVADLECNIFQRHWIPANQPATLIGECITCRAALREGREGKG